MVIGTRKRSIPPPGVSISTLRTWSDGPGLDGDVSTDVTDHTIAKSSMKGTQVTVSENHPDWNGHLSDGRSIRDVGGNFFMSKRYVEFSDSGQRFLKGEKPFNAYPDDKRMSKATYSGLFLPLAPNDERMSFPPFINSSNDDLDERGATAIARCSPTNPTSDLTTFLGELLQEGIPKVVGGALNKLRHSSPREARKHLGHEFLNYEFGWLPFISDLKDLSKSITHSDAVISQYERDSGKVVRRSFGFPDENSSDYTVVADPANPWFSPSSSVMYVSGAIATGKVIRTWEQSRKCWFSGAFTYYIPSGGNTRDRMAKQVIEAKKLLGVRLTPTAVWNLTPWSWAIDWFTNAGDVLKNLDAWIIDNQVLVYGYIMEHTVSKYTYTYIPPTAFQSRDVYPPSVSFISEVKQRRKATPYGFGYQWEGLSLLQKAILTALGLTKWR